MEHPNDPAAPGQSSGATPTPPPPPAPTAAVVDPDRPARSGDPLARLSTLEVPPLPRGRRPRRPNRWERPKPPKDWRYWVGGTGRVLIATGLLLFGFVAYQLWGTGIQQAQAQNRLGNELEELEQSLATAPSTPTTAPTATTTAPPTGDSTVPPDDSVVPNTDAPTTDSPTTAPADPLLEISEGDPIGIIEIPSIGVSEYIVAGVRTEDLRKGPGHYPLTPFPGQLGNAALAGHRTTYGGPFFDLDKLQPGDEIVVTMIGGNRYVYRMTGAVVVTPQDFEVVLTTDPAVATLTLTTCHPAYTARERLVISALMDTTESDAPAAPVIDYDENAGTGLEVDDSSDPFDTIPGDDPTISTPADGGSTADPGNGSADAFSEGWFSDPDAWPQVALWALALIAICTIGYQIAKALRRTWVGVLIGIAPFVVGLYFFFENVNRLLPPNL